MADFLTDARLAGADVPAESLEKTIKRLQRYVKGQVSINLRWGADSEYYSFATRAYAAYVLAKVNRLTLSDLRRLYEAVAGIDACIRSSGRPEAGRRSF